MKHSCELSPEKKNKKDSILENWIMENVPNHTLIGDSDEEYARLEEKIKFIEDLIQEISD